MGTKSSPQVQRAALSLCSVWDPVRASIVVSNQVQQIQLQDQLPGYCIGGSRNVKFHLETLPLNPALMWFEPQRVKSGLHSVKWPRRARKAGGEGRRARGPKAAGGARKVAWQQPGRFRSVGRQMEGKNREQKLRDEIFPPVVVIRFFSGNCIFILVNRIQVVKASKEPNARTSCVKKGGFEGGARDTS